MSLTTTRTVDRTQGSLNIRSPGADETIDRLDSYLAVLEDNRQAARFVPRDAVLALDMASFVCGRLRGNTDRPYIPVMRLSLALIQSDINEVEQ
ncbi:MAG: hypothetical protein K5657_10660 [Desulfovibrio sp.]|nr:hypothetical protein [Desulfovibrio sp.]